MKNLFVISVPILFIAIILFSYTANDRSGVSALPGMAGRAGITNESVVSSSTAVTMTYASRPERPTCAEDQGMVGLRSIHGDKYFCVSLSDLDKGTRLVGDGSETYTLTGYFQLYEEKFYGIEFDPARDTPKTYICKGFVVIDGSEEFIKSYIEKNPHWIDEHPVIPLDRVRIRYGYKYSDEQLPAGIFSATLQNPYTFKIKLASLPERGRNPCEAFGAIYYVGGQ